MTRSTIGAILIPLVFTRNRDGPALKWNPVTNPSMVLSLHRTKNRQIKAFCRTAKLEDYDFGSNELRKEGNS